jgi:sec-independent protein translocase protein TatC
VVLMADITNYLKFVLTLFVAFGVAFETPVAVVLLVLTNLLTLEKLRAIRGYVLIAVFIIAAILTPPDVLSQFSMAVPMYLLYEGGILFASILRRSNRAVEVREEEESA